MTQEQIEKQMWVNYDEGYKAGCSETVDKTCEWLKDNHADIFIRYIRGYEADDEIELLKKYMEEQQ